MRIEQVLSRLHCVRRSGRTGFIARCPAHDDRHPSLSLRATKDGTILVKCFAGCSTRSVVTAIGLTMNDLFAKVNYEALMSRRTR